MTSARLRAIALASLMASIGLAGCKPEEARVSSADQVASRDQEARLKTAAAKFGLPELANFTDKAKLKGIYELRDQNPDTITYTVSSEGKLTKLCNSEGFPIADSTQYTSPSKYVMHDDDLVTLPQAEPDGLFKSPNTGSNSRWVFCVDPSTRKAAPVFINTRIITSPVALTISTALN